MVTVFAGPKAIETVRGEEPQYRLREIDQVAPAGMWRIDVQADEMLFQRATAADWSTSLTVVTLQSTGVVIYSGSITFSGDVTLEDDVKLNFGTSSDFSMDFDSAGSTFDFVAGGTTILQVDSSGNPTWSNVTKFDVTDNVDPGWSVVEGSNDYIVVDTTDGTEGIGFGRGPTSTSRFLVDWPAITTTAGTYFRTNFRGVAGAVTTTGASSQISNVSIQGPNVAVSGGSIVDSAALYVTNSETGIATSHYGIWVDAGDVRIDDQLAVGGAINSDKQIYVSSDLVTNDSNNIYTDRSLTGTTAPSLQAIRINQEYGQTGVGDMDGRLVGLWVTGTIHGDNVEDWTATNGGLLGVAVNLRAGTAGPNPAEGDVTRSISYNSYVEPGAYGSTIAIGESIGFYDQGLGNGTATDRIAFYCQDTGGAVTDNIGLFVPTMIGGTNNYAVRVGNSDVDQDIIHVGVTGDPTLMWDESATAFVFSVADGSLQLGDPGRTDNPVIGMYHSDGNGGYLMVFDDSDNVRILLRGYGDSYWAGEGANIIIGATSTDASMTNGLQLTDGVAPSGAVSGAVVLYSTSGAGKATGGSGTITTFAPAEPHCQDCGRDFALEWENPKYGHLSLCMWCVSDGFTKGIMTKQPD